MKNFRLSLLSLTILLVGLPVLAAPASAATGDELSSLVDAALDRNRALLAIRDQQVSSGHRVESAGALADPVVALSFSNYPTDSFKSDETAMTGNEVRLAQMLPYPGKLRTKKEAAAQDALWFTGMYEDARLDLVRRVKTAYYRLYSIDRSIATVRSNLALLDDLSRLAETRYRVGKGKQANVLKVHLERTRQHDRLLQLEQRRTTTQGRLNTLVDRPVTTLVETPEAIETRPLALDPDTLQAGAEENRPMFAAWQARIDKAKKQKELAKLDYKPDVTLWAGYRFRDDDLSDGGTDFASAGISFNLPLNRSRRASTVLASESGLNQAYNQFADFRSKVAFDIDDAYNAALRSYDLLQLYRTGMVPQSRQLYASTLSAYQVGNADFTELLNALLAQDKYQTEMHRAVSDYLQAVARLEAASGTLITATGHAGSSGSE